MKVFCETCQELICHSCTIRRHKDHNYDVVSDTFPKHRQDIKKVVEVVVKKMVALQDALTAITRREEEVTKQRDDRIKEIRLQVQGIMELVTQTGEQLEGEVTRVAKGKLQLLGQQKEEAELAVVQLKSCKEFVEKRFRGRQSTTDIIREEEHDRRHGGGKHTDQSRCVPTSRGGQHYIYWKQEVGREL